MADPLDMTDRYNTPLSPPDEQAFQTWLQVQSALNKRDMRGDLSDYDLRGAFKSQTGQADNGHFPDTYKKPSHPTFSDESIYHGVDNNFGGSWTDLGQNKWGFTPGATNLQTHGADGLQDYLSRVDPDVQLIMAQPQPATMMEYVRQQMPAPQENAR